VVFDTVFIKFLRTKTIIYVCNIVTIVTPGDTVIVFRSCLYYSRWYYYYALRFWSRKDAIRMLRESRKKVVGDDIPLSLFLLIHLRSVDLPHTHRNYIIPSSSSYYYIFFHFVFTLLTLCSNIEQPATYKSELLLIFQLVSCGKVDVFSWLFLYFSETVPFFQSIVIHIPRYCYSFSLFVLLLTEIIMQGPFPTTYLVIDSLVFKYLCVINWFSRTAICHIIV